MTHADGTVTHAERSGVPADAIAIVGMAGRFPGASSVAELWTLVREGRRAIRTFDDDALRAAGVPEAHLTDARYVRARGVLDQVAAFDAGFFGMSPREAAFTDPQHRLFLECAVEALEDAAIDPSAASGLRGARVGVFGGVSASSYFLHQVLAGQDALGAGTDLLDRLRAGAIGSEKDFFATRVAYRLDLRGPSVDVQSACSTSALAVHLAAQSLLMHGCDVALAGGASVFVPQVAGYFAQAGGVVSRDGRCRPFDAGASGTVPGSGAGVVVLRRLEDALADGDPIRAVLLGSAVNNDGALKVGYGAPGVDGQAEVIAEALAVAGVPARSIGYIETHGTGTPLGDPIEVAALKNALGEGGTGPCALGAIKANIGHLDAASGIAGLIKAVLALEHRTIPPQAEFERLHPEIDLAGRFVVPTVAVPWTAGPAPRRAGVSSFGIGGTNVHLVLQEAPAAAAPAATSGPALLVLSARTATALSARGQALAGALASKTAAAAAAGPDGAATAPRLADVAHTLQRGRQALPVRSAVVASSLPDAVARLRAPCAPAVAIDRVVFLLPGQGAQRIGMARGLLQVDRVLRDHLASLCERLAPALGFNPWPWYMGGAAGEAGHLVDETWLAQPLLFALEVALGRRWMQLGVEPAALLGHSLGELSAACLAGVFSEEDGLDLVASRGAIVHAQPRGAMLAVRAEPAALEARLAAGPAGVVVAARNGPAATTLAGPSPAIDELARALSAEGLTVKRLATSHAFHAPLLDGAVEPFVERAAAIALHAPQRAVWSNRSGAPLTAAEATDPAYWGRQLRDTVRFGDALLALDADEHTAFMEVGPAGSLAPLARAIAPRSPRLACLADPDSHDPHADARAWLAATGRLWSGGVPVELDPFGSARRGRRLGGLPTYPFERARHWIDRPPGQGPAARALSPATTAPEEVVDGRVWVPSWRCRPAVGAADAAGDWLLIAGGTELAARVAEGLTGRAARVAVVDTAVDAAVDAWLAGLEGHARGAACGRSGPVRIVDFTGVRALPGDGADACAAARSGFASVARLAAALSRAAPIAAASGTPGPLHEVIAVVTGYARVHDDDPIDPGRATLLGSVRVASQELTGVRVRMLDVDASGEASPQQALAGRLVAELLVSTDDAVVALRGGQRWVEHVEPLDLPEPGATSLVSPLRPGALVVLIGGTGRLGRAMARWLVQERDARVVLASRSAPEAPHGAGAVDPAADPALAELTARAATLEVRRVDVTDAEALARLFGAVTARHGRLDAVFHLAHAGGRTPLEQSDADALLAPLSAKVAGTLALERALSDHAPGRIVLWSSLAALLGGPGAASYTAANAFLDAFAQARCGPWCSVGWDVWREGAAGRAGAAIVDGLDVDQAMTRLERILATPHLPHVWVSRRDLVQRRAEVAQRLRPIAAAAADASAAGEGLARSPRPDIATPYVAPRNDIERGLAEIWAEVLGLEAVGVNDPFFELGGDSLLATMLLSKITARFALDLPVERFFEAPTLAQAALAVGEALERSASDDDLEALLGEMESLSDEEAALRLQEGTS